MLDKQLATTYILTQWVKKYETITLLGKTANYCLHRAKKSNQKSPDSNEKKKNNQFSLHINFSFVTHCALVVYFLIPRSFRSEIRKYHTGGI